MKKISESVLFQRFRTLLSRKFVAPNGKIIDFDIYGGEGAVHVLPVTASGEFVMVREFRPGPEKYLVEVPAGRLEPGEELYAGATRELLEETGFQGKVEYVGRTYLSPYSSQITHVFVCIDAAKVSEPTPDENEFLETVFLDQSQLRLLLKSGEISNAVAAYMALDYLGKL